MHHFHFALILFVHTGHANFDVEYSKNVVSTFKKSLSDQNPSVKFPQHNIKIFSSQISNPPYPLMLFGKAWTKDQVC